MTGLTPARSRQIGYALSNSSNIGFDLCSSGRAVQSDLGQHACRLDQLAGFCRGKAGGGRHQSSDDTTVRPEWALPK